MTEPKVCAVEGCGKAPVNSRGWCWSHYHRWRRYGDPEAGGTTPGALLKWLIENQSHAGDDCLWWPFGRATSGYCYMTIDGKRELASRAMCALAHGAPPTTNHQALHSCGQGHKGCVNPKHLRWGTPAENGADMVAHGTSTRGRKNARALLTEDDVREIKRIIRECGFSQSQAARRFGVTRSAVAVIMQGRTWGWLDA